MRREPIFLNIDIIQLIDIIQIKGYNHRKLEITNKFQEV